MNSKCVTGDVVDSVAGLLAEMVIPIFALDDLPIFVLCPGVNYAASCWVLFGPAVNGSIVDDVG